MKNLFYLFSFTFLQVIGKAQDTTIPFPVAQSKNNSNPPTESKTITGYSTTIEYSLAAAIKFLNIITSNNTQTVLNFAA